MFENFIILEQKLCQIRVATVLEVLEKNFEDISRTSDFFEDILEDIFEDIFMDMLDIFLFSLVIYVLKLNDFKNISIFIIFFLKNNTTSEFFVYLISGLRKFP